MIKRKISLKLALLFILLLYQFQAWAAPYEVIASDESKIIKLKLNEINITCEGSYDDDYEHQGWAEDIYVAKVQSSEVPGVLFKGKMARGQGLDCPTAVALLRQEAFASSGLIQRQVRRQVVNVTYTAFESGYFCRRYSYTKYALKLFGEISEEQNQYSGYVRIYNDNKTPGKCPAN